MEKRARKGMASGRAGSHAAGESGKPLARRAGREGRRRPARRKSGWCADHWKASGFSGEAEWRKRWRGRAEWRRVSLVERENRVGRCRLGRVIGGPWRAAWKGICCVGRTGRAGIASISNRPETFR